MNENKTDKVLDNATLIIGAGGHLMSAIAMDVAEAGSHVICADFRLEDAERIASEIRQGGLQATAVHCDVTSDESLFELKEFIARHNLTVDKLINGAGINAPTPVMEITRDEWHSILEIQLVGVFRACQIFAEDMLKNGRGSIINISSASANPPLSKAFVYSAAKSAIVNITKNLAREWALGGVRVNAIRPGFFPTAWNLENFIDDKRRDDILRHTPMSRFGEPQELGACAVWLLSKNSSFVTGAEITVDGGFSAMSI